MTLAKTKGRSTSACPREVAQRIQIVTKTAGADRCTGITLFKPEPEDLVRKANLAASAWTALSSAWKLKGDLRSKQAKVLCRALFRYCAAIAHSPQYELDHKDSLSQGWPQIPIARDKGEFDSVVALGDRLTTLLDPRSDATAAIKALVGADAKTLGGRWACRWWRRKAVRTAG